MQSRRMSIIEAVVNTVLGFVISVWIQIIMFGLYDVALSVFASMIMTAVYTLVSIVRGYFIRRFFNWYEHLR